MSAILKIYDILLDIKRATTNNKIEVVEGDNGNVFRILLTDNNEPVDLSGTKVVAVFSSGDGTAEQDTSDTPFGEYTLTWNGSEWVINSLRTVDDLALCGITLTGGAPTEDDTVTVTYNEDGATAVTSVAGATVTVDRATFAQSLASVMIGGVDNNEIDILVRTGSYSSSGVNECELQIYSGDNDDVLVTTAKFNFQSRRSSMNDETLQSEEKFPLLVTLLAQANDALNNSAPWGNPSAEVNMLPAGSTPSVTVVKGDDNVKFTFDLPSGGVLVSSVNGQTGDVVLDYSDVGADASGTAASAVSTHDDDASAHASLFDGKQDTISDLATIRSGAADGTSALAAVTAITEIKVSNPTVGSDWTTNTHSSDTDGTYVERLAIPVTGVTSNMIAEVTFGVADAASGEYSPICECGTGVVYIWAKTQTAPTVLSILVHQ